MSHVSVCVCVSRKCVNSFANLESIKSTLRDLVNQNQGFSAPRKTQKLHILRQKCTKFPQIETEQQMYHMQQRPEYVQQFKYLQSNKIKPKNVQHSIKS